MLVLPFARATDGRTRASYAETLPNPKLRVFPIAEVAASGRPLGIPLIVDSSAAPLLARPLEHGEAIVMYPTTKHIGGHGTSIGGIVIDGGHCDWSAHKDRQPLMDTPDRSYHGAVWAEAARPLGPIAYSPRARVVLLRDLGAALSPSNAFQILQGLETLPLRMERHTKNAQAVADGMRAHAAVARVIHPSTLQGEDRERAARVMPQGLGGLVGIELEGGLSAGRRFIDALKLSYHVANIGDARSLAIHPASTTHSQLSSEDQIATGVSDGYVRLSIGIEHIDDIRRDFMQAHDSAAA